jgi:hypothetical protein
MLRRVRVPVRIAGLVVFGPGHTRHASAPLSLPHKRGVSVNAPM